MTGSEVSFIVQIAAQLPILAIFIWYSDRQQRHFDESQAEQQKRFDEIQKEREALFVSAINKVADALEKHDGNVERRINDIRTATTPLRRYVDRK